MGFHKRYINDAQVISIFQKHGCPGVIDWFTKGADAVITSGKLALDVRHLMNILPYEPKRAVTRIDKVIADHIFNNNMKVNIYIKGT